MRKGPRNVPITRDLVSASRDGERFYFYADISGKDVLFSLSDLISTICSIGLFDPSQYHNLRGNGATKDCWQHYAYNEIFNQYLSKGALFSADATDCKTIKERTGSNRWYVNKFVAKALCLFLARTGESKLIRDRARILGDLLNDDNLDDLIKIQLELTLEVKMLTLKAFGIL